MKTQQLLFHLGWAMIAGGAWWLGLHQAETERLGGESTKRSIGVRPPSRLQDPSQRPAPDQTEATIRAGSVDEWLRDWIGKDGRLSPDAMAGAMLEVLQDPDPVRGLRRFTHLLAGLTAENAPMALAALKSGQGRDPVASMALFCAAWGAIDGAGAMGSLSELADQGLALTGWAHHNPGAAAAWVTSQSGDSEPGRLASLEASLVRGLARGDAEAAIAYIRLQPENRRGDLARALTSEHLNLGAPAAAQWAMELTDPTMRGAALEAVARHYMAVDPHSGAAWAAEIATGPDTRDAVARVADRMAERDVEQALAWTRQLQSSPGQLEAYEQVFSEWARKDPTSGSQELLQMPAGRERDSAIHSFSRTLVNENPGDAIVWASAITDPGLRLDTQIDVARTWNQSAPAAAGPWIANHLPPDAQSRALRSE